LLHSTWYSHSLTEQVTPSLCIKAPPIFFAAYAVSFIITRFAFFILFYALQTARNGRRLHRFPERNLCSSAKSGTTEKIIFALGGGAKIIFSVIGARLTFFSPLQKSCRLNFQPTADYFILF